LLAFLQEVLSLGCQLIEGVSAESLCIEPSFSSHPRQHGAHGSLRKVKRLKERD